MISVNVFFADVARDLVYGLHFANVATRELALAKAWKMGKPRQMFEVQKNMHICKGIDYFCKKVEKLAFSTFFSTLI